MKPLSVDKFKGLVRRPAADKIENGAHTFFENVNLDEQTIRGNRGKLKQMLTGVTDYAKNGLFYYENSDGTKQLIRCTDSTVNSEFIHPVITGFFAVEEGYYTSTGHSFTVDAEGSLYAITHNSSNIRKYNKYAVFQNTITIPDSCIGNAIAVDDDGTIYVTCMKGASPRLYKMNNAGTDYTYVTLTSIRWWIALKQGLILLPVDDDVEGYLTSDLSLEGTVAGIAGEDIKDISFAPDGYAYALWDDGATFGIKKIDYDAVAQTTIVTGATDLGGHLTVDERGRIWVVRDTPGATESIHVYNAEGTLLNALGEVGDDTEIFDFFRTYDSRICSIGNELYIYEYYPKTFMGIKVFVFSKWD